MLIWLNKKNNAATAQYNRRGCVILIKRYNYKDNKNKCVIEKKKYLVYLNDEVTEPIVVFSADTIAECKDWIEKQLEGLTPVDDEHPCSEDVMNSSHTFYYEVYEGDMIVETNRVAEYNDLCYASDYYYRD